MKQVFLISPDGFAIHPNPLDSEQEAWEIYEEWVTRYEAQGYYSSNQGRIELSDLKDHMIISDKPFKFT